MIYKEPGGYCSCLITAAKVVAAAKQYPSMPSSTMMPTISAANGWFTGSN